MGVEEGRQEPQVLCSLGFLGDRLHSDKKT